VFALIIFTDALSKGGHLGLGLLGCPGGGPQPLPQPPGHPRKNDRHRAQEAGHAGGCHIQFLKYNENFVVVFEKKLLHITDFFKNNIRIKVSMNKFTT